ncbi:MAG: hypothetical protein HZB26_24265 [Candidatus Hydrogenedentes bacterium]|nr:hypothetical protein [Candidatus Hydrogenedentota bacterium]
MSDTIRTYSGRKAASGVKRRSVWSAARAALTAASLLFIGFGCWVIRDAVPLQRMIPAGEKYNIIAIDVLNNRGKIANSPLWRALPESIGVSRVPDLLTHTLGLPDWVFNNLIGEECHLSGNDVRSFGDAVFATKMRPIGVVIERFHWLAPGIERDAAGGLELRRLANADVYYAVRGRVLIVSRSRDSLIRAVTLREQDSLSAAPPATDPATESGAEDLRGTVALAPGDPLGDVFSTIRFAARIDTPDTLVKCRAALSQAARQRFGPMLEHAAPRALLAPPDGLIEVSGNFGEPIRDFLTNLGDAMKWPYLSDAAWERWETGPGEGADASQVTPRLAQMLTQVAGPAGPSFWLTVHGVDVNEIIPTPEIVGVFEAKELDVAKSLREAAPPLPANAQAWESYVRYNAEEASLYLPLPAGGPSMTPTAMAWGDDLLISTSRRLAAQLAALPPVPVLLPHEGNLFVLVRPSKCVQALADASLLLADVDGLRGYTRESLEEDIARWTAQAGIVQEIWALASHQDADVTLDIGIRCAPPAN